MGTSPGDVRRDDEKNRTIGRISMAAGLLALLCAVPAAAADPIKIYVMTDLEGVSGVFKFAQTREKDTRSISRPANTSWATWPPSSAASATAGPTRSWSSTATGRRRSSPT